MNQENLIYQWLGYLSNPVRMARVEAEMPPHKEHEFREHYRRLTGHVLTFSGKESPFYVWKRGVNKRSGQLRVYFVGEKSLMPQEPNLFSVRDGRSKDGRHWRINNGEFVGFMFRKGFLLGSYNEEFISENVPHEFSQDFEIGFNMASPQESFENILRNYCNQKGVRTFDESVIKQLGGDIKGSILSELEKRDVVKKSRKSGVYTLKNTLFLKDEIEQYNIKRAIAAEANNERREYLVEIYARDHGWKRIAKKVFGTNCMCNNCRNSFIKEDGTPYIETHHIVSLHEGGEDGIWNLSVLCAHHHRMAHFARKRDRDELRQFLLHKNQEIIGRGS